MDPTNWAWSLGSLVQQRAARETAEQRWERRGSRVAAAAGAGGVWRGGNYGVWSQAAGGKALKKR
jgi:hypothetical protein